MHLAGDDGDFRAIQRFRFELGLQVFFGDACTAWEGTYPAIAPALRDGTLVFALSPRPAMGQDVQRSRAAGAGRISGCRPQGVPAVFEQHGRFTAGMGTHYGTSPITAPATYQHLATGFVVGTRFHSAPVLRVADARPLHLGNVAAADGRWRLYAFSGTDDPVDGDAGVRALCNFLSESTESPIFRYTRPGDDIDALFDVRAIFQRSDQLDIEAMPALLLPRKGRYGLLDYEKVFWSDPRNGDIFDLRGIDRKRGALVVVRPDQYIANVLPLDAHEALAAFFAGFMLLNGSG